MMAAHGRARQRARCRSTAIRPRPIGVFDSGVGGLTVLHELLVRLPREDFVYLGDTARFPYGERSPEELERVRGGDRRGAAAARRAKLLVVACNSATAAALPSLRRRMLRDDARRRRARRRAPRGAAGGGGDAHRADRAAGDADDGRQRRLRARR